MDLMATVDAIASSQHGLVTRGQLLAIGVSEKVLRRLLNAGYLQRLHAGVYRCLGVPRSWEQDVFAAILASGPRIVASHATAARLLGLVHEQPSIIEAVCATRGSQLRGAVLHRTRRLEKVDVVTVEGIPCTAVPRTLLDLAGTVRLGRLAWLFDRARALQLVTTEEVLARIDEIGANGWSGAKMLRVLITERIDEPENSESEGEIWLGRELDRRRLKGFVAQYVIVNDRGIPVARPDFTQPVAQLALEYDGLDAHGNPVASEADKARDAELYAMGWLTLRATKATRRNPEPFFAAVKARLREFGIP